MQRQLVLRLVQPMHNKVLHMELELHKELVLHMVQVHKLEHMGREQVHTLEHKVLVLGKLVHKVLGKLVHKQELVRNNLGRQHIRLGTS